MSPNNYPGVYIKETPGGLHVVTGVATSIAAFLGRAARGPVDRPTLIHSFGEYESHYGGLALDCLMSYAVKGFFQNGGRQAVIQRLYRTPEGETSPVAALAPGGLNLVAASPGAWGRNLFARLDRSGNALEPDLFNLEVIETGAGGSPVIKEWFTGLSTRAEAGESRVDRVLEAQSRLVRVASREDGTPDLPEGIPTPAPEADEFTKASGGVDSDLLQEGDYEAGLALLEQADLINLLCIPPDLRAGWTPPAVYRKALEFCVERRAMLIVDPNPAWCQDLEGFLPWAEQRLQDDLGFEGPAARNAALYFPPVLQADPLQGDRRETFPPCGLVAGVIARIDESRGVWKAPAGAEASLTGVEGLEADLSDRENGILNPLGINCLRSFPTRGSLIWGARTLRGADQYADEYKYVPVRRLALYIEESIERGTQWAAFEPNDEALWAQIRTSVNAFMNGLFLQGAFLGSTPHQAYFIRCDAETTSQADIDTGVLNLAVGFAPVKPAEFLLLHFRIKAGQEAGEGS
jgi:hypothetical protein